MSAAAPTRVPTITPAVAPGERPFFSSSVGRPLALPGDTIEGLGVTVSVLAGPDTVTRVVLIEVVSAVEEDDDEVLEDEATWK